MRILALLSIHAQAIVSIMAQSVLRIPDAPPSSLTRTDTDITIPNYSARLYTASYENRVTTFDLKISDSAVSLIKKPANEDAGPDPTWLELDSKRRKLFCLNEQLEPSKGNASFTEYDIQDDGTLKKKKKVAVATGGPVQSKFLSLEADGTGIHVVAHYSPGTFTAYNQILDSIARIDLAIGAPGPTKRQQEGKSNGHGVITHERLGSLVLVPDLSQDKIWVINCTPSSCSIISSITVPPGTGPRHGTLWEAKTIDGSNPALYLFVVGEISNKIEGFKIDVDVPEPKFEHVSTTSATQTEIKEDYAAAEILTSPDDKYVVVSNRANNLSQVEECDVEFQNCTTRPSDTIATFRPKLDGTLENVQSWSSGGSGPRAFDFNANGDLVAIGLDKRLVIVQRDVETGQLAQILTDVAMGDQVTSVVWDEVQPSQYLQLAPETKQKFLQVIE